MRIRSVAFALAALAGLVAVPVASVVAQPQATPDIPVEPAPPSAPANPAQPPSPPPADRCLMVRSIDSWNRIDDRTLFMTTSPRRKFKVTFVGPCRQANWSWAARVEGFGMCLRPGDTVVFNVGNYMWPNHGWPERCMIQSVEALPPDAMPPRENNGQK